MNTIGKLVAVMAFAVVAAACGDEVEVRAATQQAVESCICPAVEAPVCGVDGVTYGNSCHAECAGTKVAYEGACVCKCPAVYDPVCGDDGKTYGNACEANCAGVKIVHDGECKPSTGM